ncbi:MAG: FtsX-like permease family protein, partial [Oscillospiraceae bacterium]|nr:FtsX-like permease family protein [Oscillospiraceae bacterium]
MKTSLFLLKKYWFAHKKAAVAVLFSVIVLIASLVCSFLSEIMEQRREINSRYDTYGHYSFVFSDPTADTENELKRLKNEGIINFGEVTVTGKIGDGSDKFAVGYLDKTAEYLLHYPVKNGRLPEKENEIAISELLMPHLGLLSEVGDTIKLPFTDSNGTTTEKEFLLCGIFAADNLHRDTELTSAKTTRNDLKMPTPLAITGKNDYTPLYKNLLVTDTDIHSKSDWLSFFSGSNGHYKADARITKGTENFANLPFTTFDDTGKRAEKNEKTETVKILELLGILIALVAIISTFSAVFSVISNRINDFQLLKCVGYSKKSLLKMFIIECFIFLIVGIILGLICGCVLYEIVYLVQIKFMNLAPYSGFFPEPIIREITISPYILPIITAAAVMIIAYIYPAIKIYKLSAVETKTSNIRKNKKTSAKINTLFSRIIGGKGVAIIQCSALIIVMCTSIFGYLYYTNNNKKNTDIIMDIISDYAYSASDYKIGELDMKSDDIDCYIEAKSTYVFNGNSIMENQGGLKQNQIDAMVSEFDRIYANGYYLNNSIVYQKEEETPQNLRNFIDPLNPDYDHYEDYIGKAILRTDMKFLNNALMEKLKPYLTEGTLDGVISINYNYNLNYKVGD